MENNYITIFFQVQGKYDSKGSLFILTFQYRGIKPLMKSDRKHWKPYTRKRIEFCNPVVFFFSHSILGANPPAGLRFGNNQ